MTVDSGSIRVLHVDDEPGFADMVGNFLERADDRLAVESATSASEGLELLDELDVDCVVSDYDMPGRNGIEFLEVVREDHPDLPFVLYTGKGSEEVASDAFAAGATDYLQKEGGTEQYELLANRVVNAVEKYRSTHQAAELDRIRTLASDVNKALVRAASREAVERRVCDILSDAEPYQFAWVGAVDPETGHVEPRASAGLEGDYLDDITVSTGEEPTGQGPGGTAIREGRVAVSQDVAADPAFEPWRSAALERGFRAVAAVPLEHRDALYGVLVVYADRPDAFDAAERDLLAELGDDVAHAFHSFDIRDRLRRERDRREALFENAPGPVVAGEIGEGGDEHRITAVNEAFEEVFGFDADEVVGRDVAEVIVPEAGMDRHGEFRERAAAGEATVSEVERVTADGPREFLLTVVPVGVDAKPADGWYAWFTDISERSAREDAIEALHRTSDALMEAQGREEVAEITVQAVRDVLELPANGVHLYEEDAGGLVPVAWTARTEELVGEPPTFEPGEGLAGRAFRAGEPRIYDDISTVSERFNPDTPIRSQLVLPLADHGVLVIGSPEVEDFDQTDVTLAKTLAGHASSAIDRLERERHRRLMEQLVREMNDGAVIVQDGRIEYTNPALTDLVGYAHGELAGEPMTEFVAPGDRDTVLQRNRARLADDEASPPQTYEIEVLTAEGRRVPVEVNVGEIEYDGRSASLAVIRDVTERRERERKLTALHDVAEDLATGETVGEICDRTIEASHDILDFDLSVIDLEDGGVLRKQAVSEDIPLSDMADMAVDEGIAGLSYRTGESFLVDDLETREEANPQGPYRSVVSVPIGDHGVFQAVAEAVGAFDETDLELAELLVSHATTALERVTYEEQLERQNDRLEEFAGVVSHDLTNPLNVAQGELALARERYDSEHLDEAARAVDRGLALIDDLLTVAREGSEARDVEVVDLAATVEECWGTVATGDATGVIETDRAVRADRSRLKQLVENLVRNAVEHGGDDVTVTVGDLADGFYVADDGPGIPPDRREEVFEAGYSTTPDGTGFGLNIARKIATAHGWEIRVTESEAGGARFEITGVASPE